EVSQRLRRRDALRPEQILAIEDDVGVDERRQRRDASVRLGHARASARGEVVPVEVGAGEALVVEELVQRVVPASLPEALLLDVERGEEGVDPARVRRHLDGQLLPRLDLRQRLPLHLHPRERLELGDVLLEHVDEGVLGQEQEELFALEAFPGEALRSRRRRDKRPGGDAGGHGFQERAAGESAIGHWAAPSHRVGGIASAAAAMRVSGVRADTLSPFGRWLKRVGPMSVIWPREAVYRAWGIDPWRRRALACTAWPSPRSEHDAGPVGSTAG